MLLHAVAGDPTALSYLVASAALLTTEDRQALLAESATRRRLAAESRLLRRELTLLRTLGAVPVPLRAVRDPDDGQLSPAARPRPSGDGVERRGRPAAAPASAVPAAAERPARACGPGRRGARRRTGTR